MDVFVQALGGSVAGLQILLPSDLALLSACIFSPAVGALKAGAHQRPHSSDQTLGCTVLVNINIQTHPPLLLAAFSSSLLASVPQHPKSPLHD